MLIMETPVSDTAGRLSLQSAPQESETKATPSAQTLLEKFFSTETGRYDTKGLADSLLEIHQKDPQMGQQLKNDVAAMLESAGNPLDAFHFSKDWEATVATQLPMNASQDFSDTVAEALFGNTMRVIQEKPDFSMTSTVTGFLENFVGNTATDLLKLSAMLDDLSPVGRMRNAALSSLIGEDIRSFNLVEDLGFKADPGQEYGYAASEIVDALALAKGGVKLLEKGAGTAVKAAGDLSDAIIKSPHQASDRVLDATESSVRSTRAGDSAELNVPVSTRAETTNADLMPPESVVPNTNFGQYSTAIDNKVTVVRKNESIPDWVQESFLDSNYRTVITNEDITVYRVFGGNANPQGAFVTTSPALNKIQAKIDAALLPAWKNTRAHEAEILIPKGTRLDIGKVAPQTIESTGTVLDGLSDQLLMPQNWPKEWIQNVRNVAP